MSEHVDEALETILQTLQIVEKHSAETTRKICETRRLVEEYQTRLTSSNQPSKETNELQLGNLGEAKLAEAPEEPHREPAPNLPEDSKKQENTGPDAPQDGEAAKEIVPEKEKDDLWPRRLSQYFCLAIEKCIPATLYGSCSTRQSSPNL